MVLELWMVTPFVVLAVAMLYHEYALQKRTEETMIETIRMHHNGNLTYKLIMDEDGDECIEIETKE